VAVTTVYAIAYLERSPNRARFFGFFSICVTATMGIAMAGNLLTFFVFYELLTLATWPLVVHTGTRAALRPGAPTCSTRWAAARCSCVGLIWLYALAGPQDFIAGGSLALVELDARSSLQAIFVLVGIGMGVKAALVPLHAGCRRAMVAPAPVSALLHAVAVVKAGAFGLVRLVEDVFGSTLVGALGMGRRSRWPPRSRSCTARCGAAPTTTSSAPGLLDGEPGVVHRARHRRRRPLATVGGMVHLVHQGVMKITMFFCAGTFATLPRGHSHRPARRAGAAAAVERGGLLGGGAGHDRPAADGGLREQVVPGRGRGRDRPDLGGGGAGRQHAAERGVLPAARRAHVAAARARALARRQAPGRWVVAGWCCRRWPPPGSRSRSACWPGRRYSPLDWAIAIAREYVP
jgi:hypothetical protein